MASPLATSALQTPAPVVSNVEITTDAGSDSTYHLDQEIRVQVTFNADIQVSWSSPSGSSKLALVFGTDTVQASLDYVENERLMAFRYYVALSDMDSDGLSIPTDALTGTIKSADGTVDAMLGLGSHAVTNDRAHKVDGSSTTVPSITRVSWGYHRDSLYTAGERIIVWVYWDAKVRVHRDTGGQQDAQLMLRIGTETRRASLFSTHGLGTAFDYHVQASDRDSDGISIAANALTGTITLRSDSMTSANMNLGSHAVTNYAGAKWTGAGARRSRACS